MQQWLLVEWADHAWLVLVASRLTMPLPSSLWALWLWLRDRSSPSMEARGKWWWERFPQRFGRSQWTFFFDFLWHILNVLRLGKWCQCEWCRSVSWQRFGLCPVQCIWLVEHSGATTALRIFRNHHAVGRWSPWHEGPDLSRVTFTFLRSRHASASAQDDTGIWFELDYDHAYSTLFNVLLETLFVKPSTWCDCISHCKDSS